MMSLPCLWVFMRLMRGRLTLLINLHVIVESKQRQTEIFYIWTDFGLWTLLYHGLFLLLRYPQIFVL